MGRAAPKLIYHPIYSELELPERHRYPIGKYKALYQALLELDVPLEEFVLPKPLSPHELTSVHCPSYIDALCQGHLDAKAMRRIGFPWSEQLIKRSLTSLAGTTKTVELALKYGLALHLSGGYHHAFADYGTGFCLFNDIAFAARRALALGVEKVLIFDCDVHQGDGNALLFANESAIVTCSLHGEKNFPFEKQRSDWDLELSTHCDDTHYLQAVEQSLEYLIRLHRPELVIYDAGVDIHHQDELGKLSISSHGVARRDYLVLKRCLDEKVPVAAVIGGGYQRDVTRLIKLHLQLFFAAFSLRGSPLPMHPTWKWCLT